MKFDKNVEEFIVEEKDVLFDRINKKIQPKILQQAMKFYYYFYVRGYAPTTYTIKKLLNSSIMKSYYLYNTYCCILGLTELKSILDSKRRRESKDEIKS